MAAPASMEIQQAAEQLRRGRLVAFPTETVYGLGADALNAEAVASVYALKGRPGNNPLIVHVADAATARRLVSDWPDAATRLAERFWPGPLTLVMRKSGIVPLSVTAGGGTVAVRCPDHPVALGLLRAFGGPMVGPSANASGAVSPTTAAHVRAAFPEAIARHELMVLDGGACRTGIESTVLDISGAEFGILRRGAISAEEIGRLLGRRVEVGGDDRLGEGAMPSPGMLSRHYSPRTPARLFDEREWPGVLTGYRKVVVIAGPRRVVPPPHLHVALPEEAEAYAAGLYAALHEADAAGGDAILIQRPGGSGSMWDAVRDRLTRACGE
ncbi:MAG: threonylcarbamoyl-AMP synthase [Phycisphaerae bacterium]|nr:threonylcarbamoyl-AMP synthase [Phycisphaerae bacterium]